MSFLEIIFLAVVQGVTEFLPISSDGHLILANELLTAITGRKLADPLEVTIILHLGTLAAVLVFYRREILRVLTTQRRAILPIVLGTIPAVIVGLTIEKALPEPLHDFLMESPLLAGIGFLATAAALWWGTHRPQGGADYPDVRPGQALAIGALQASAILPGVSRSGMTIAGGLASGLTREAAAAYSFLLAIPAIGGAGMLKTIDAIQAGKTSVPLPTLALGFVVSMVVGLVALALLLRFLQQGKLHLFTYYLVPLGLAVIVWQLAK